MRKRLEILTILIALFGVLMVYSASSIWALGKQGNSYYYLIRQIIFFALGVISFLFVRKIDYHIFQKYRNLILLVALILLIAVLIPGIGVVRGGARSWIGINQFAFQPSEIVKLSLIIFSANYLSKNKEEMDKFSSMFLLVLVVGLIFGLIMLEPDFGTGFIIVVTIISMLLISGIKNRYIVIGFLVCIGGAIGLILSAPYRLQRIFAYLDPWSDPLGSGFQIIQSLYSICPNGIFGAGLFNSVQKHYFLPEPQTDFIFSIIMDELGLIGGIVVVVVFFYIFYDGIVISLKSKDLFGTYLAFGIIISLFIQFFVNVGVVIGLLPVTGVTLPFLSYGGSSLIMNFIMIGIVSNVAANQKNEKKMEENSENY